MKDYADKNMLSLFHRQKNCFAFSVSSICFFIISLALVWCVNLYYAKVSGTIPYLCIIYTVIFIIGLYWQILEFGSDMRIFLIFTIFFAASMMLRMTLLDIMSGDYTSCLLEWGLELKEYKGIDAMGAEIGNYNIPYLFILFIISRLKMTDLYLIKAVSTVFDLMLAIYCVKLVSLKTKKNYALLAAFFAVFLLPTVVVNSAWWAQCDSIYAAFGVAGLYYALRRKGSLSMIMFSLSLCFKLQGIFLFPMILVFLVLKKIKPLQLLWLPIIYVITISPALIGGRSLQSILSIYSGQTSDYNWLTANCPNIYTFFGGLNGDHYVFFGLFIVGIFILAVLTCCFYVRKQLDEYTLLFAAFLITLGIVLLLPKMHERYSYLCDCLAVILVFYDKKNWKPALLTVACSVISYMPFLTGTYPFDQEYIAIVRVALLIYYSYEGIKLFNRQLLHQTESKAQPLIESE